MTDPIDETSAELQTRYATRPPVATWADSAGVLGAVFAALCCAGAPAIVSVLATLGLTWLRQDAILWPLMFVALAVAMWALHRDQRLHHRRGPLAMAVVGAVALVAGVVFVHGPPAIALIDGGALLLVLATLWNVGARIACRRSAHPVRPAR